MDEKQSININLQIGAYMDEFDGHIKKGQQLLDREKYIDAIREFSEAEKISSNVDDDTKADLYSRLSQAYYGLNPKDRTNSEKYCRMSMELHRKTDDPALYVMDLINMSYIYSDSGAASEAENFIKEAIKIAESTGDATLISMVKLTYAEFQARNPKGRGSALTLYQQIRDEALKNSDWESYFESTHGIATILRETGKSDEAWKMVKDAIDRIMEISSTIKNKSERKSFKDSFSYLFDMGSDMAMENGNVEEAIKIAQKLASE